MTAAGSLGLLALGAIGIKAWRKKREEEKSKSNSDTKVFEFTDIKKFYSKENEDLFKQLVKDVGNKRNIYVALPCPEVLIAEYNSISQLFCSKIGENPHFKEILKKHSTIEDYHTPSV